MPSSKPVEKPKYPTWAVLEPGNLPNAAFIERALGAIIPHSAVYQPTSDYIIPSNPETLKKIFTQLKCEPSKTEDSGATAFVSSVEKQELKGKLSKILDVRTYDTSSNKLTVETQTVYTHTFLNSPRVFDELKKDPEVKETLTTILDREGVADMIIGLKTCVDAQLSYKLEDKSGSNASVGIPINEIIAALGGPPIPVDLALTASANFETIKDYVAKHQAKGERVFALQYRRIMTAKRWREAKKVELQGLEIFDQGLFAADDEDVDDDELTLCPAGELPDEMMTM